MRPLLRLRWQLTLSHLVAIAFTLLSMVAAIVLVAAAWSSFQGGGHDPVPEARVVARAVAGMVADGAASPERAAELNVVLGALVDGRLRLLDARAAYAPEDARWAESAGPSLRALRYAVVLRPDGAVVASSDPSGAGFAPPERAEWARLVAAALAPTGREGRGATTRGAGSPLAAAPILGPDGRALGAAVVAAGPAADSAPGDFWHSLAFFSAASAALLAVAFLFALVPSGLFGYLLSRRLTGRLERLGQAAAALAAGLLVLDAVSLVGYAWPAYHLAA